MSSNSPPTWYISLPINPYVRKLSRYYTFSLVLYDSNRTTSGLFLLIHSGRPEWVKSAYITRAGS